jgi:hypothetical protein
MKKSPFLLLLMLVVLACTNTKRYERSATGITVFPKDEGQATVRLMVYDDNIIRVSAIPADSFATDKSLMLVDGLQPSESWVFSETDSSATWREPHSIKSDRNLNHPLMKHFTDSVPIRTVR